MREETTPLHVKAQPLFDRLCIRQTFRHQQEQEQEISRRRRAFLQQFAAQRRLGRN
ncbi:hypothetical protein [Brucella pseudogrignonensis]|uniref:hypothetical protein n=1 Tax=Brucella pseudogrignonensis TaxID=419475 RepID=UPI0038D1145B